MRVAFVAPDGVSTYLFCQEIINTIQKNSLITKLDVYVGDNDAKVELDRLNIKVKVFYMYRFFNPILDLITIIHLIKLFKFGSYDAVLCFTTKPNIYGVIAAKIAGIEKIYFHVVGLGMVNLENTGIKAKLIKFTLKNLYKFSSSVADKVWFTNKNNVTEFLNDELIASNKVVLTKNYLDTDYYHPKAYSSEEIIDFKEKLNIDQDSKVVVMVARMIWSKGVREFVDAADDIYKKNKDIQFILIAPLQTGSLDAIPVDYANSINDRKNIRWLEFQDNVRLFYALSDISVLPTYYQEGGYPRALLEPMSMGKPVITTDNINCKGAVDHEESGLIIPQENSKALSDAICQILSNDELMAKYGKNSRLKAVNEFNEKIVVKEALESLGLIY